MLGKLKKSKKENIEELSSNEDSTDVDEDREDATEVNGKVTCHMFYLST